MALAHHNVLILKVSRIALRLTDTDIFGNPVVSLRPLHFQHTFLVPVPQLRNASNHRYFLSVVGLVIYLQCQTIFVLVGIQLLLPKHWTVTRVIERTRPSHPLYLSQRHVGFLRLLVRELASVRIFRCWFYPWRTEIQSELFLRALALRCRYSRLRLGICISQRFCIVDDWIWRKHIERLSISVFLFLVCLVLFVYEIVLDWFWNRIILVVKQQNILVPHCPIFVHFFVQFWSEFKRWRQRRLVLFCAFRVLRRLSQYCSMLALLAFSTNGPGNANPLVDVMVDRSEILILCSLVLLHLVLGNGAEVSKLRVGETVIDERTVSAIHEHFHFLLQSLHFLIQYRS